MAAPQRLRDLLNGYVRWIEQALNGSIRIADDIKYLCLLFLNETDSWNEHNINPLIKIDANKAILNKQGFANVSVYLSNIVKHGKHVWRLKYITSDTQQKANGSIGIHKIKYPQDIDEHFANISNVDIRSHRKPGIHYKAASTGYSLNTFGQLSNPIYPGALGRNFYVGILPNDIVDMIVDLNQLTLSFIINGNDRGDESIAFGHIDECGYRAAVGMKANGNTGYGWKLISYCSLY